MSTSHKTNKLWGAAFDQSPEEAVIRFTSGRDVHPVEAADNTLLTYDLWVNKAHALMLYKQNIIDKEDATVLLKGLEELDNQIQKGGFVLDPSKEDVHSNIESWLIEKYGMEHAGKLHTARSRNDQINTDTRLYLRDCVLGFMTNTLKLVKTLVNQAELYKSTVMPGFTHHQPAMITTYAHTLLAYAAMLLRDAKRFGTWFGLYNANPLGNTVSYGTSFPIDQQYTSKLLGFTKPELNSMDGIVNRWEPESDLVFSMSLLMNHLSLMSQTYILMSTVQFKMVKLSDKYSTGSSIMPQKKNPDPLEVIKGKTALVAGILQSLLGTGKAAFIGYNRDTQWTKYLVMDAVNECMFAPVVMQGVVETLQVNKQEMERWCRKGFIGSTHLLEKIASEFKIPFRQAKIILEKSVKYSQEAEEVTYVALQKALQEEHCDISVSEQQVKEWQDPQFILSLLVSEGSPGILSVNKSIEELNKSFEEISLFVSDKKQEKERALSLLQKELKLLV